jgi:hypothetical protein
MPVDKNLCNVRVHILVQLLLSWKERNNPLTLDGGNLEYRVRDLKPHFSRAGEGVFSFWRQMIIIHGPKLVLTCSRGSKSCQIQENSNGLVVSPRSSSLGEKQDRTLTYGMVREDFDQEGAIDVRKLV